QKSRGSRLARGPCMDDNQLARHEAVHLCGRLTVAIVFIASAVAKGASFDPEVAGRLGAVFWLSVVLELVCGALLLFGLWSRRAATVLLLWIGVGVVFFHGDLSVDVNRVFTLANVAIGGGLFVLVAHGGGMLSLDHLLEQRRIRAAATP